MKETKEIIIEIKDLSFAYQDPARPSLHNINIRIQKGDFIGITGPTGAGKTTLFSCLNGIIPHFVHGYYGGEVWVKGRKVWETRSQELAGIIGSVFQDPEAQIVSANVEEELAFGPENLNVPPAEIARRINFALSTVGISHLSKASIASLSGGQKQRVAIAAVLATTPEIIILDEPTSELDPVGTDDVFCTLKKLNEEQGITIIVIEHKMEHLARYCSRLLVMKNGGIVVDGKPAEIFSNWRNLQILGVKPPEVTELIGRLLGEGSSFKEIPVTLEEALGYLRQVLSAS